jgi:expansin (peptidoglycan-binding protein)
VGVLALVVLGASALRFVTASCAAALPRAGTTAITQSAGGAALGTADPGPAGSPGGRPVMRGQAYFYNPGDGDGSCSFAPLPADGRYASVSPAQYAGGAACGSYLDVTGPDGTVRAEVVDLCPGCSGGGLDMSEAAFGRVASTAAGTAEVSYRVVRDPRLPGPLELRLAQTASPGWLAVQVLNTGNPLRSVRMRWTGQHTWQPLVLSSDDYWAEPAGAGPGPFRFLVTDAFGHRAVLTGIRLLPGSVQRTRVRMYSAAAGQAGPARASGGPAGASGGPATHGARPGQPGTTPPGSTPPAAGHRTGGPAAGARAAAGAAPGGGRGARPGAGAYPSRSGTGPHC